jgi:hypothetical protein
MHIFADVEQNRCLFAWPGEKLPSFSQYPNFVSMRNSRNNYRFAVLLLTVYFYMPVSRRIPLDSAAEQGTGRWN